MKLEIFFPDFWGFLAFWYGVSLPADCSKYSNVWKGAFRLNLDLSVRILYQYKESKYIVMNQLIAD